MLPPAHFFWMASEARALILLIFNVISLVLMLYFGESPLKLCLGALGAIALQRIVAGGSAPYAPPGESPLAGRVAVISGANSGCGYHTALGLAKLGCTVVLACRSQSRAQEAMAAIQKEVPGAKLRFIPLDLEDLASVRKFTDTIYQLVGDRKSNTPNNVPVPKVDILINNAGLYSGDRTKRNKDGIAYMVQVNFVSHVLLTERLLPLLRQSKGRIINLSSCAHTNVHAAVGHHAEYLMAIHRSLPLPPGVRKESLTSAEPRNEYGLSKALMAMYARELACRVGSVGVTACSLHPGAVATEIFRELGVLAYIIKYAGFVVFKTGAEGAYTTLHCATLPAADLVNGGYYQDSRSADACLGAHARDDDDCRRVVEWARCVSGCAT